MTIQWCNSCTVVNLIQFVCQKHGQSVNISGTVSEDGCYQNCNLLANIQPSSLTSKTALHVAGQYSKGQKCIWNGGNLF